MKSLLLIIITVWSTLSAGVYENGRFSIDRHGDLILGGLFPIHLRGSNENECGAFQTMPGYHYLEAMLFALDKINNDTSILPNITLGARIYDSCHSQTIGAKMTKELITLTLVPPDSGAQLAGVIGPQSSDLSKVVADFLRVFEIPQISYGATATVLSDKTIYSNFFRTVPPDTWQAKAMVDIILKLGWNFVVTINSNGLYGEKGIEAFRKTAKKQSICIAQTRSLSPFPTTEEFDQLIAGLNEEQRARAVVLFTNERDTKLILEALRRNSVSKKFYWIASDTWGNNADVTEGLEELADGAITVSQLNSPVEGFDEYFRSLNVSDSRMANNSWLRSFWQNHFKCSLEHPPSTFRTICSGDENLSTSRIDFAPIRTVVNAVYAMAHALHNYVRDRCPNTSGLCEAVKEIDRREVVKYLRNTTFVDQATGEPLSFHNHQETIGDYSIFNLQKSKEGKAVYFYRQVGVWKSPRNGGLGRLELNVSELVWSDNNDPPESRCSDDCHRGYVRKRKENHDIACCWTCFKCGPRDTISNNTCETCAFGHAPDVDLKKCMKLALLDVMSEASSKVIIAISMLGFVVVIIVAAIFFKHSNTPLIKASSRELSGIILFGLALLFIFPLLLLIKPNDAICICQPVILGFALASCYAPLFMKILRIYRIFNSARKSAGKPILVSPASQVLITMGLIMIQLLFSTISFFPTMPVPEELESPAGDRVILECSTEKKIFASLLSYNMLLMALCTVMAFKTRRFPRNFNEAKYIGFTMYFTCFVWIIFFPSYLSAGNGLRRINWEAGAVLFIGWITLLGLFAPKVYLLFLGRQISVTDQLAVTNNTMSQASVVHVNIIAPVETGGKEKTNGNSVSPTVPGNSLDPGNSLNPENSANPRNLAVQQNSANSESSTAC